MSEHEENYNDGLKELPNAEKINIMWEKLSKERQGQLHKMIVETLDKFKQSGKLEIGKIYPIELTHGFDQEEPKQYVYIMCAFRYNDNKVPMMIAGNMPVMANTIELRFTDVEVFKEDKIFDWLDHVNRIEKGNRENKNDQLFYEDNIFKKDKDGNSENPENEKNDDKETKKTNPNQCGINQPIEDDNTLLRNPAEMEIMGTASLFKENEHQEGFKSNNNNHGLSEKELFDFYEKNEPVLTNEEYVSLFRVYSRDVVNNMMVTYYNHKSINENDDSHVLTLLNSLKNLQFSFSNCDFWNFNKEELGQLGFINWSDEILLIPAWAFPVILNNSKDKKVYTPTNEEIIIRDIDVNEKPMTKYGCVPFGFKIEELKS